MVWSLLFGSLPGPHSCIVVFGQVLEPTGAGPPGGTFLVWVALQSSTIGGGVLSYIGPKLCEESGAQHVAERHTHRGERLSCRLLRD